MKNTLLPLFIISTSLLADHRHDSTFLNELIEKTTDYRKSIHNSIINTSSNVDNFFFEDKLKNVDYNEAYGLLELSISQNQHEDIQIDQKFKVKLKLPRLKENIHLEVESDDERESIDFIENKTSNSKKDNINFAIAHYKKLQNDINIQTKIGLKIKSTFDPFIKVSADKTIEYNDTYYTISQSLKESKRKELESTTYFKIDKPLTNKYSVHNYNQHYWQSKNKEDNEFYSSLYLNQTLSNQSYIRYTLYSNIDNINSNMKVKRYAAQIKYRHFLKKWLYIDTIPENYYKRELDFKPRYGIKFNIGMYFNKDSY